MSVSDWTPTPCPICHLPGGFHDTDDEGYSYHREYVVPRHLVRLSNTAIRKTRPRPTAEEIVELRATAAIRKMQSEDKS